MTDASKWLAGSVPFAAAVFGFLGVTDGEVTRILVNFQFRFVAALVLILIAAGLGALVPVLDTVFPVVVRLILLGVGLLMLIGGLGWMAHLAAESASASERPRISTKLSEDRMGQNVLSAEFSGAGLRIDEHLIVTVTGRPRERDTEGILLYGARVGPDVTGSAAHSLAIPVNMSRYQAVDIRAQLVLRREKTLEMLAEPEDEEDCNEESSQLACVTVFTPSE